MKAFLMTRAGDIMMLAGMFLIFAYAGTFGFTELLEDPAWAITMSQQNLLVQRQSCSLEARLASQRSSHSMSGS